MSLLKSQQKSLSLLTQQDNIITKIMQFKGQHNIPLIKKFNLKYVMSSIDRRQIQQLDTTYKNKTFNILNFVRYFVNCIPHQQYQTLYLVIAIIELYHQISKQNLSKQSLNLKDITNYICNKILNEDHFSKTIDPRHIPLDPIMNQNYQTKQYVSIPPFKYGTLQKKSYKLSQDDLIIDKNRHQNTIICTAFSPELKKVFTLDALTQFISVYDEKCRIVKTIRPTSSKFKKDVVVLCFAFSQKQQRIGAVLKDYSLNFWDAKDNFEYQKTIPTTSFSSNCQTNIWYLQKFNSWITADKAGIIYIWDLVKNQPQRTIQCKFKQKIQDICEIPSLNLLAVVQQINQSNKKDYDTKIVMYNFQHGQIKVKVQQQLTRIPHLIQFSNDHQVLLSAGFQKKIKIYEIHPKYLDCHIKGQLIGHDSLITCFTILEKTPLVISSDDKGKVKMWDIRTFNCLQTIDFCDKSIINRLLDMVSIGKVGVFGSRINFINFQNSLDVIKQLKNDNNLFPIKAQYDEVLKKMIVLTEKDLRMIDFQTGALKHLFCSFINRDDDITFFKYFSCLKKFVIGNQKGEVSFYDIKNGKIQDKLNFHQNAITSVDYDDHNRLFITSSFDSHIFIYKKKSDSQYQVIRQLKNNFNGNQIIDMQLSVYHSFIGVISLQSPLYIWDYQLGKILGEIKLGKQLINYGQITSFIFINGYSCLVIGTSLGLICILKLERSFRQLKIQQIWRFNTNQYVTHFIIDSVFKGSNISYAKKSSLQKLILYASLKTGQVYAFNLVQIFKMQFIIPHSKFKSNYNPQRQIKQNFTSQIIKNKFKVYQIKKNSEEKDKQLQLIQLKKFKFKAHDQAITSLQIIELDQHFLMTSGNDKRVKIWRINQETSQYQLLCDTNINWPLPYLWNFTKINDQKNKLKDQIMFALKVIKSIFKKYASLISITQARFLKVQNLFQLINDGRIQTQRQSKLKKSVLLTQYLQNSDVDEFNDQYISKSPQKQKIVLQDQFKKNNLHYKSVRKFNFTQIAGPTLREMDVIKKHEDNKRQWKIKQKKQYEQKQRLMKNIQYRAHKLQEKQQVTNFLTLKTQKNSLYTDKSVDQIVRKLNFQFWNYTAKKKEKENVKNVLLNRFLFSKSNFFTEDKQSQLSQSFHQSKYKSIKANRMKSFENYYDQKNNITNSQQNTNNRIKSVNKNNEKNKNIFEKKFQIKKSNQLHKNYNYLSSQFSNKKQIEYRSQILKKQQNFRNIINQMNQRVKQSKINNNSRMARRLKTEGCQRNKKQSQFKQNLGQKNSTVNLFSFLNSLSK